MANQTGGVWIAKGNSVYAGGKMILMAAIKDVPDEAEREANLAMAAASKDLLDACSQMLWALDNGDKEELENGKASARMAIKKART